jgi:hypothetical protein
MTRVPLRHASACDVAAHRRRDDPQSFRDVTHRFACRPPPNALRFDLADATSGVAGFLPGPHPNARLGGRRGSSGQARKTAMRLVTAALCIMGVLIGIVGGLTGGYTLWGQEATEVPALRGELEKTRSWLLDEISLSDERCENLQAGLTKAQADLVQTRRDLARSRAILDASGIARPDLHASDAGEGTRPASR